MADSVSELYLCIGEDSGCENVAWGELHIKYRKSFKNWSWNYLRSTNTHTRARDSIRKLTKT